jgi:3-oxoacyl-(acyl-carrier-protein) synthase
LSVCIAGMGWVTPLGAGLEEVRAKVAAGDCGAIKELTRAGMKPHLFMPVPPGLAKTVERLPRLRRSSAISLLTATAGLAALENAGVEIFPGNAEQTAVVFAIGDGGVIYTRRFYEGIITQGAASASPLLFPETVYNAPASHLAALLGITGMTYTLVGDSSAGISALHFGAQLLETSDLERVVVVGGEEIDWILCEAYAEWRLARQVNSGSHGMILSEGAAAIVLARSGPVEISRIHAGAPFHNRRQAPAAMRRVLTELMQPSSAIDVTVCSANGTFIDAIEQEALHSIAATNEVIAPKLSLGEPLGGGALMQTILAALTLENRAASTALVSCLGLNQQAAALLLRSRS